LASRGKASFAPLLSSPLFWWINASIAAAFLIALPLVLWLRRRAAKNAAAQELQWALKQAQSALAKASDRAEFYNAAAHLVQARLAVGEGKKARFIDTGAALRRQVGDPVMRREIESVLGRRDELKYGGNTAGSLDPAEKNRVVAVLEKFSANHD
jgi:type II secretory pathway pseudopilin PulG